MKNFKNILLILIFTFNNILVFTQNDPVIDSHKSQCGSGNTSMEWSSTLNRCVQKVEAYNKKQDVKECNKIEDLEQRKACQLSLANNSAALNESAEGSLSKLDSGATRSAIVNGANTIISAINFIASGDGKSKNTCMCKNILSATAIGGTVTDILMKIKKDAGERVLKANISLKTAEKFFAPKKNNRLKNL